MALSCTCTLHAVPAVVLWLSSHDSEVASRSVAFSHTWLRFSQAVQTELSGFA